MGATKLKVGKFASRFLDKIGSFISLGFLNCDTNLLNTHVPLPLYITPVELGGVERIHENMKFMLSVVP